MATYQYIDSMGGPISYCINNIDKLSVKNMYFKKCKHYSPNNLINIKNEVWNEDKTLPYICKVKKFRTFRLQSWALAGFLEF